MLVSSDYHSSMGVRGLTTFLDNRPDLLTDVQLHDVRILIDGNNLMYFLYGYFSIPHHFGGDYDTFARKIRYFFETLHECGIQAYVILDGGSDKNDKKLAVKLGRVRENIHKIRKVMHMRRCNLLPQLSTEVFKSVLREMQVPLAMCDFEADEEIAALAKLWNCPVLTNDSDFFIYQLPAGTILLDYFNLEISTSAEGFRYLAVQVFYNQSLLEKYPKLEYRMWPLFATLRGNDYVGEDILEPFHAKLSRKSSKQSSHYSSRTKHFCSVLTWLEHVGNFDLAIEKVLACYKSERRAGIHSLLMQSVDTYLNQRTALHLFFSDTAVANEELYSSELLSDCLPPAWFLHLIRQGALPVFVVDALVHQRVLHPPQVESTPDPSVVHVSRGIRQVIYRMLHHQGIPVDASIVEYARDQCNLKKFLVPVKSHLDDGSKIPSLHEIPGMTQEDHESLLLSALNLSSSQLRTTDPKLRLLLAVVLFWLKNSDPPVNELHLICLIGCFVKVQHLDKEAGSAGSAQDEALQSARQNWRRFIQRPLKAQLFAFPLVHAFGQFQTCIQDVLALNQMLMKPWPIPNLAELYNGSLLYHLYQDLKSRGDPKQYVSDLFGKDSRWDVTFREMLDIGSGALPESSLRQRPKRKSRGKGKKTVKGKLSSGAPVDDQNSQDLTHGESFCDVSNPFHQLALMD